MSVIELSNVTKTYIQGDLRVEALKNLTLTIEPGAFVAVMGPSGSGKSTLMNLLGLLDRPTDGKYLFSQKDVSQLSDSGLAKLRRERLGFVFQSFNLFSRKNALDNVAAPLFYAGVGKKERRTTALQMLERVGLTERSRHKPKELSGGQQQRVAIARALVNSPKVILADEPTGNLDQATGMEILSILQQLNTQGVTLILVTHDEKVAQHTKRIVRLIDGYVVQDEKIKFPLDAKQTLGQIKGGAI